MNVKTSTLKKIEARWTIILERENGSADVYRFNSKSEARRWAKFSGVELENDQGRLCG